MASINITVDGVVRSVESDQRPTHIFADDKSIVVARVNGEIRDLWSELKDGDAVEGVAISSPDGLAVLRHSTAHVLAQAVQQTFAQTRLGIGPPIRDGFYYDFEPERPFTPEDLEKIETAMRKIVKEGQRFKRRVTTESDALKELAHEPISANLLELNLAEMKRQALKSVVQSSLFMTTSDETVNQSGLIYVAGLIFPPQNLSLHLS